MKELKALLDKYWNGKSDIDEEKALKQFLSDRDASPDTDFFRYLNESSNERIQDTDFDRKVLSEIGLLKKPRGRNFLMNWRVAAVVALLLAASVVFKFGMLERQANEETLADTYEDPEKAFEETKKALLFISSKLNEGSEYTQEIGKFSESQEKLKKN